MESLKIHKEEFDTTLEEISRVEKLWGGIFPKDYKKFLLAYNGGRVYPAWPILKTANNHELWPIERFLSIGDIELSYYHNLNPEYDQYIEDEQESKEKNLRNEYLLTFARAERGSYFFNLEEHNDNNIYYCNYAGGEGIDRVVCRSFEAFLASLGIPKHWKQEEHCLYNNFINFDYSKHKVFQSYFYSNPLTSAIAIKNFKNVFKFTGDIPPPKPYYKNIIQTHVHNKVILEFLINQGCSTDGLLNYSIRASTIKYLISEIGLNINEKYNEKFPLQIYLTNIRGIRNHYKLVHDLLILGIEMDWNISATLNDGTPDLPMIEKLGILHSDYLSHSRKESDYRKKNGLPEHTSFIKSKVIEDKVGISKRESWLTKLFR